jgi:arylsulfatase A-like enzyme
MQKSKQTSPDARPNVIWIIGDQHRGQALSCMGDPNLDTPNIDCLAGVGATGIGGSPLCSPFRGSLLTSQYPHKCVPGHDHAMPDGMPTVATAMRDAGYRTAFFGKWHVDGADNRPQDTRDVFQNVRPERGGGFGTWLGYELNNSQWDCWVHGHDESGSPVEHHRLPGYETDALTDLLIGYVKDRGMGESSTGKPFFAVLSVQPPHSPYLAPPEWMARHRADDIQLRPNVPNVPRIVDEARRDLAGYYAMVENLDWNVGRVEAALKESGLHDTTYVVFFSDHGDMHGSHGLVLKCVPYEESIRNPFIVGIGDRTCCQPEFAAQTSLLNHVDIAPTTLGLCGIDTPGWMVGHDYSRFYLPEPIQDRGGPDSAYLQLVDPGYTHGFAPDRERPWRGVVTRDGWKYAVLEGQPWMMFNLNEDPYELANIVMDRRFVAERKTLQERLGAWIEDTGDSFKLPEIG